MPSVWTVLTVPSCAAMNGVAEEVVKRAENLILLSMRGEDLVAACCQIPEDEAAELAEAVSEQYMQQGEVV
jgi:DNA mismatch repair protein MSH5